jgi:hypothetical protein
MVQPRVVAPRSRRPLALAGILLAGLALAALPACVGAPAPEVTEVACSPASSCPTEPQPACTGDDPATFCDDENPCTVDVNCTPCSELPAWQHDIYHCTADEELPELCTGHAGCFHAPQTTPAGQVDDCFPVAEAASPHAGSCRVGVCVENGG